MTFKKNTQLLIILNNNFTALSMLSFYFQNLKKYKNINIFLVIDETYKNTFYKRYNIKIIFKILKIIDPKLNKYLSIKIPKTSFFSIKNSLFFLKNFILLRKKNSKFTKEILKKIKIDFDEIWTGNSEFINFFPVTNKVLKFEHGLSEISQYIKFKKKGKNFLIYIKSNIEKLISENVFYKKNYFFEFKLISIFKSITKETLKNVIEIKKNGYIDTIRFFNSIHKIKSLKRNKNVIINYPLSDYSNKHLKRKFNYEFANFIKIQLKKNKIGNNYDIIIKRKPSHNKKNVLDLINIMKNIGIENKVIFFENIYKTDLIVDFFIEKINPKILITNLNSSVIVFNKAFPNRKVILTDKFVVNFIEKNNSYIYDFKNELSTFNQYKENIRYFI